MVLVGIGNRERDVSNEINQKRTIAVDEISINFVDT
jgi:hypothetical protein